MANPRRSGLNPMLIHSMATPARRLVDEPKKVDQKSHANLQPPQNVKPKPIVDQKEVERINEMRARHLPSTSCPLTLNTFDNPVLLPSGHTYENNADFRNYIKSKGMDPLTRTKVSVDEVYDPRRRQVEYKVALTTNFALKNVITEYNENVVKEIDALTKSNQELKAQNEALKKQLAEAVGNNQQPLPQAGQQIASQQQQQQVSQEAALAKAQQSPDMIGMSRLVEAQTNEVKRLTQNLEEQSKKFAETLAKKDKDIANTTIKITELVERYASLGTAKMTELVERYQSLGTAVIDAGRLVAGFGLKRSVEQMQDHKSEPIAALSRQADQKLEVAQLKSPDVSAAVVQQKTPDRKVEIAQLNPLNANVEVAQQKMPDRQAEVPQEKVQVSLPLRHPQNQPVPYVANSVEIQNNIKQEELDLLLAQELQYDEDYGVEEQPKEPVVPRRYPPPQSFFIPSSSPSQNVISGRRLPPSARINQMEQYENDFDDNGGEAALDLAGLGLNASALNPVLPGVDYKRENIKQLDVNFLDNVKRDFKSLARMELTRGANVNAQDENGDTALHLAAQQKSSDMIKMLLEFKPNLEAVNKKGECPLDSYVYATKGGGVSIDIVNLLRKNRSDPELLKLLNVNAPQEQQPPQASAAPAAAAASAADQKSVSQVAAEVVDRIKRRP